MAVCPHMPLHRLYGMDVTQVIMVQKVRYYSVLWLSVDTYYYSFMLKGLDIQFTEEEAKYNVKPEEINPHMKSFRVHKRL